MSCEIYGIGSCTRSFHSLTEQDNFAHRFGKYLTIIDEQKDKIKELEKQIAIMQDYISSEDWEEIDKKI